MTPTSGQAPVAKDPPADSRRSAGESSRNMKVRLFIKPYCGWCDQAMDWLDSRGVKYEVLDVMADASARQEMEALSGQSLAPVLDVDGQILADFDTGQLEKFWNKLAKDK